ncbi:MAG: hypothetical protein COB53_02710 [Elusimicrobia bacterium]|nr:MAG: hypothetical protein COB53_02710 [Elusimicrobiota bacterium]
MAPSKADFTLLLQLHEKDLSLDDMRRRISQVPEDVAAIQTEIDDEKTKLESVHAKSNEVQAKKKDLETTVAQKEASIKKHEGDLNQVKANDAYKALLKEIEDAKVVIEELETEILELMEVADEVSKEEKGIKSEIEGFTKEREGHIKELETKKTELEAELAKGEELRKGALESVPSELATLYEKTRERRKGIAVSRLHDKSCGECRVMATPQALLDVAKGSKIVMCDSCQRILLPGEKKETEKEAAA